MRHLIRATTALTLLALSLPAAAATAVVTRAWQFKPESKSGLTVRNLIGDVQVLRGTDAGVHVTVRATVEAKSQAEADRLAGLIDYRSADVGAGSRFDVRLPEEHFPEIWAASGSSVWWGMAYVTYLGERIRLTRDRDDAPTVRVDLVIRAPAGAKLDVENLLGDSTAQGYSGELRLDSGSGMLRSAAGEGRVELDSGSGKVEVTDHRGKVIADTGSGSVLVTGCDCEIDADTGSGSVDVRGGAGELRADTGSGRVTIEGWKGSVTADTGSGSVRAKGVANVGELNVDTGSGSVTVEGDLSELKRLRIDTGSGSVRLQSSAAPSLAIRVDTGSGDVDVDAPGANVQQSDGEWMVRLKDGAGSGNIDTGSGSVELRFP